MHVALLKNIRDEKWKTSLARSTKLSWSQSSSSFQVWQWQHMTFILVVQRVAQIVPITAASQSVRMRKKQQKKGEHVFPFKSTLLKLHMTFLIMLYYQGRYMVLSSFKAGWEM